jgi:carbon storage regulator
MLVLSRKPGEQIQIDGHITVTVLGVEGKRIRLGIDAPREVPIVRTELKSLLEEPNELRSYRTEYRESDGRLMASSCSFLPIGGICPLTDTSDLGSG